MKKLFALFSMLMLSLSAHAAQFKEGEHYKVLDLEVSKKPLVTEFFSFYCPHCNTLNQLSSSLKSSYLKAPNCKRTTCLSWVAIWALQ